MAASDWTLNAYIVIGFLVVIAFLSVIAVSSALARRAGRDGGARLWQTALTGGRPMPEWDGQTWELDWPEGHLAEYFFGDNRGGYAASGRAETSLPYPGGLPVPDPYQPGPGRQATSVHGEPPLPDSGDVAYPPVPFPDDDPHRSDPFPDDETGRFIEAMRARTDWFITAMSQPQPAWAGQAAGW